MAELFTDNNDSMFTAERNTDMDLSSFLRKSTDNTSDDTKKSVDETNPLQKELEYQKNRQLGMSITSSEFDDGVSEKPIKLYSENDDRKRRS